MSVDASPLEEVVAAWEEGFQSSVFLQGATYRDGYLYISRRNGYIDRVEAVDGQVLPSTYIFDWVDAGFVDTGHGFERRYLLNEIDNYGDHIYVLSELDVGYPRQNFIIKISLDGEIVEYIPLTMAATEGDFPDPDNVGVLDCGFAIDQTTGAMFYGDDYEGRIYRVDPDGSIDPNFAATFDPDAFGWVGSLAIGSGAVWAADRNQETVFKFDLATGEWQNWWWIGDITDEGFLFVDPGVLAHDGERVYLLRNGSFDPYRFRVYRELDGGWEHLTHAQVKYIGHGAEPAPDELVVANFGAFEFIFEPTIIAIGGGYAYLDYWRTKPPTPHG